MKTLLVRTLLLTFIVSTSWSCKKDYDRNNILQSDQSSNQISMTENRIKAFIDGMNIPTKDDVEFDVDSAVWYLEATLNYTYSIWDSAFSVQKFDSSFVTMSLNQNEKVDEADVYSAYDDVEDSLGVHWDNISGTKHVIVTDVKVESISNGTVRLRLISAIGSGNGILEYGSFGDDDHWFWGWNLGGCGPNQAEDSDAGQELEFKYLHPIVTQTFANRVYFTDVEIYEYIVPGQFVDENSPSGYRLFEYEEFSPITSEPCIVDEDLDYYLYDGIDYIVDYLVPSGYDFSTLNIIDDQFYQSGNEGRRHILEIWYGEIDQTSQSAGTP